ncbi:g7616 [Coccomyxa elongata]
MGRYTCSDVLYNLLAGVFVTALVSGFAEGLGDKYLVGTGKADITGPAADVNLMGYAAPGQLAAGIHTRLYARAYIIGDITDDSKRFVFVNLDACMASQGVTMTVLSQLKELYGGLYHEGNVAMSGIHTHSGPGGYLQYILYIITSLGFVRESFDVLVGGIVEAIRRAHDNVAPGRLQVNSGELLDANANRSPTSYLANPAEERARYKHNTDKEMTLLKVLDGDGRGRGAVAWFPVHCTSINNTNSLISGDNKGVASQFMEEWAVQSSPNSNRTVGGDFIAAFGQSNVGDTSPNILGAFCQDTGEPCEKEHSTCNGRNEMCIARGPAWEVDDHGFKSNEIIARRQSNKAQSLWQDNDSLDITGSVDFRHMFLDMSSVVVEASNFTRAGRTCRAAMGFSFAAGTTDGPGAFDFKQGDTNGTLFWKVVRHFLKEPSADQVACQAPKPIILDTGSVHVPYEWQPAIVDIQILRVGQLVILCVPGEFTTMAGRRLREAIFAQVRGAWGNDVRVVLAGLTNTYSSYVTTFEEYSMQRYEGASTIFGPHTLDAYIQEFSRLAEAMVEGRSTPPGPSPPNMIDAQWSFLGPVVLDTVPNGSNFGDLVEDVAKGTYEAGSTAKAVFWSACPRNNVRLEGTFLAVERQNKSAPGGWDTVYTDNHVSTKFYWARPHMLSPESTATITWDIPEGTPAGMYRLRHFGDFKHILGGTQAFSGASRAFQVGDLHPSHGGGSGSGLSDWELFVRENGYLIPLALFAMFLVASVVYRQVVSSNQREQYSMLADS